MKNFLSYITQTVDEFFFKLDKMQGDLAKFSQSLDNRSEKIPTLLKNFEQAVFATGGKKISGDKVSDNAIARKQENPRRLLNSFVDSVIEDLKIFGADLGAMTEAVEKYKADMERMTALIVANERREVRSEVSARANEWNRQVKRGAKVDNAEISEEVSKILQSALNEEIDSQMRRVIENFQSAEMKTVKANISAAALEKKTVQIAHTYTTSHTRRRDPRGFFEHVGNFSARNITRRTKGRTPDIKQLIWARTSKNFWTASCRRSKSMQKVRRVRASVSCAKNILLREKILRGRCAARLKDFAANSSR